MSATQAVFTQHTRAQTRRLKVIAEADPGALARILQPFQMLNVVPARFEAGRMGEAYLEVCVEVNAGEMSAEVLAQISVKLGQLPVVMAAVTCD